MSEDNSLFYVLHIIHIDLDRPVTWSVALWNNSSAFGITAHLFPIVIAPEFVIKKFEDKK